MVAIKKFVTVAIVERGATAPHTLEGLKKMIVYFFTCYSIEYSNYLVVIDHIIRF